MELSKACEDTRDGAIQQCLESVVNSSRSNEALQQCQKCVSLLLCVCVQPHGFDRLRKFREGKVDTSGLPNAWEPRLRMLEAMDPIRFGHQMRGDGGGWFAMDRQHGPVFIKKFNRDNTKAARDEMKLYKALDGDTHRLAIPSSVFDAANAANAAIAKEMINDGKNVSIMFEQLAGGDLYAHVYRAHHEEQKPYSEDEVLITQWR